LLVVLKGAPDKVFVRCSHILINGEEREMDEFWRHKAQKANDKFAAMGERVLAFAQLHLDPQIYTKKPAYPFDIKNWKNWSDVK